MTEDTRYQEKLWPEWMSSRYFMTIGGQEWLNINDVETEIPPFGWVVRYPSGSISAVDYSVMEAATKLVVDEPPERDEPSEVNEDELVALAAKLAGVTVEEFQAQQAEKQAKQPKPKPKLELAADNSNIAEVIDQGIHEQLTHDDGLLLNEVWEAFELCDRDYDEPLYKKLVEILGKRVNWCSCPPGLCVGSQVRGCRQNSPLAK